MKAAFGAKALVLMLVTGLGLTGCINSDQVAAVRAVSNAQAASGGEWLYPQIQDGAADGQVHEYH